MSPSEQQTYAVAFLTAAGPYPWWWAFPAEWDSEDDVPNGWSVVVRVEDRAGDVRDVAVTHAQVLDAIKRIAADEAKGITAETFELAKRFLADPEPADWDAASGDQVLQLVTLGAIVHE
ncbi:hypothetical protein ACFV1L_06000 [Kitasatospora sp. NPDC059646]|uniref:hypothetical protein n=1 Tax=Kitasatospora sp. NPDC059646 TaxID=3346893 RepID=UPI00369919E9